MILWIFVVSFDFFCFFFSFFFSSRRRHTSSLCDWSSDVCSSALFKRPARREFSQRRLQSFQPGLAEVFPVRQSLNLVPIVLFQIGRASCRETGRVTVVDVSLKKKGKDKENNRAGGT